MRFAKAAERTGTRGQPWPRVVGAVALAVLAACGAVVLVIPRHASAPSLASRSNWVLAGVLPTSHDFPADWGYSLHGALRSTAIADTPTSGAPQPGIPRAVYAPEPCTPIPKMLDHTGAAMGPGMNVDRSTTLRAAYAALADADATGERSPTGPNADLTIWVVPDGAARIANYVDWLGRCGSYQVTNYDGDGTFKNRRHVHTVVEGRSADGADAAVTVTRTFITPGDRQPLVSYHVTYYALRGVILECASHDMKSADRDLVQRRVAETLRRLRAL